MPDYLVDVSRHQHAEEFVLFEADRESAALEQALNYHPDGLHDDGHNRARIIARMSELTRDLPLSRSLAHTDLNDSSYFHVQPCYCDDCDPRTGGLEVEEPDELSTFSNVLVGFYFRHRRRRREWWDRQPDQRWSCGS